MKLEYKGRKWDQEVANFQKMMRTTSGALNNNELFTINKFLNSKFKDYLRLYSRLFSNYERMATYHYLNDITSNEVVKYTYFSGYAMLITKYLYEKGIRTEYNEIVENAIKENIDFALHQLIAVGEIDNPYIGIEENNLIVLMYYQKYEQARLLLSQLPDDLNEAKEIYYVKPQFLKKMYIAIIDHDEKKFNEELVNRIKRYRKNMVGYSTIIDIVSVALIKMAEKEGIHCLVDVIEIPKQFFGKTCKINKDKDKLPFYDDFLELVMI